MPLNPVKIARNRYAKPSPAYSGGEPGAVGDHRNRVVDETLPGGAGS
jgi:hypothetical protein